MGGVAALAKAAGHHVTGSDDNAYPPMSTQLAELGVAIHPSDDLTPLDAGPDRVVIGNVMRRGQPLVEAVLDRRLAFTSGPAWLAEHLLRGRRVIAVAGTHGKTTTASLVTSLLRHLGEDPGFLIGGVAPELGVSAHAGTSPFFVVEADEYDTAFFDKRAKFVHYHPEIAVLGNLEFDHADIYPDLAAIERQVHHLVRTVPGSGRLIVNASSSALKRVLAMGAWTAQTTFGTTPGAADITLSRESGATTSDVSLSVADSHVATLTFPLLGQHNLENAAAALAALTAAGFEPAAVAAGLAHFRGVRRRLEPLLITPDISLYDDFAHHPTAIAKTLQGLADVAPQRRLIAVLEPRSNTMRGGTHAATMASALAPADLVFVYQPSELGFSLESALRPLGERVEIADSYATLRELLLAATRRGDMVVLMSNGSFGDLRQRLPVDFSERFGEAASGD